MKFNYGESLRIRSDVYTILGKIRYIDTHGKIGYEYKLVRHKNNAEFWLSWDKKRDAYSFSFLSNVISSSIESFLGFIDLSLITALKAPGIISIKSKFTGALVCTDWFDFALFFSSPLVLGFTPPTVAAKLK